MTKKTLFFLILWLFLTGAGFLSAQTVAEEVLKGQEIQGIEFRNYIGPHKVIESRLAIQGIGADLGRQMKTGDAKTADYAKKYRVIRIHDAAAELLSADLFILEAGAGVDHIRNLNWIVSAYLQQAFGYSVTDADLLSSFVTRYNAFYRGKIDYIASQFIAEVGANVTAENVGLALSYSDWPGKTRMVIPLRDSLSKGLGGSLNTEEISNQEIVAKMADEPGAGLEVRKKLADLKEGEIVQEQKAVTQAEAKVPAAPTTAGTTPSSPSTAAPSAAAVPATAAPQADTPAALPIEEAKKDLAARDQALQAERQDIVKQETKQPATTPAPVAPSKPASTAAFVKMSDATKAGQLWLIDPSTNKVWKKSELNTIRQSEAPAFGPGVLVVAGDAKAANGAIRLVLVSKDDATVLTTGTEDVPADTPLIVSGNQVLALTKGEKTGWVLGAFDTNLKPTAKGTDLLSPLTAIVPTANGILVQGANGTLLLLDASTLKKKSNTEG